MPQLPPELMTLIPAFWPVLVGGPMGVALRVSTLGIPNGGREPRSALQHAGRLVRLWIEATSWSMALIAATALGKSLAPVDLESPAALGLAAGLGAALSGWLTGCVRDPAGTARGLIALGSSAADVVARMWGRGAPPA
jgi:hypothetical protein